ncbi:aminotransferase class V-fold PLP-dependent enzyme, partial [Campylobacter sp. 2018MI27]|uniref:aminotransferase class V-fold PLP-dependent enzyme n=1 Tax=Campylobacter sp. 2018MI27 TaxID=2836738 RepID=UPI001BDAAB8B
YRKLPDVKGNVVAADMSSNILAQRYNVEDFGLIMAGAQKNIGPGGLPVVIVKHSLLDESQNLPSMLDYVKLSKKHSTLNTPPVFAIYAAGLVFKQLLEEGGVDAAQKRNEEKSRLLYEFLDSSKLFKSPV